MRSVFLTGNILKFALSHKKSRIKRHPDIYYPKKKSDQSTRDNAKSDQQSDNKSPSESSNKFTDQEVSNTTPTSVNEVVSQNSSVSINLEKS